MKRVPDRIEDVRANPKQRAGRKPSGRSNVSRILVGVRIEPRLVKVMKALAELHDNTLGELIERVFWVALDGNSAFSDKSGKMSPDVRQQIQSLKQVYGVDYSLDELIRPREKKTEE